MHDISMCILCMYTVFTCFFLLYDSRVDLPFSWEMFKPLTELQSSDGEDPVFSGLIPASNSPFSVFPSSGTLPALSNHTFLCQFLSKHVRMSAACTDVCTCIHVHHHTCIIHCTCIMYICMWIICMHITPRYVFTYM